MAVVDGNQRGDGVEVFAEVVLFDFAGRYFKRRFFFIGFSGYLEHGLAAVCRAGVKRDFAAQRGHFFGGQCLPFAELKVAAVAVGEQVDAAADEDGEHQKHAQASDGAPVLAPGLFVLFHLAANGRWWRLRVGRYSRPGIGRRRRGLINGCLRRNNGSSWLKRRRRGLMGRRLRLRRGEWRVRRRRYCRHSGMSAVAGSFCAD